MMVGVWMTVLADAGMSVESVDPAHVLLRLGGQSKTALVRRLAVLSPSKVPATPGEPGLLVAPRATARALDAARSNGWDVVTETGQVAVRIGGRLVAGGTDATAGPSDGGHPGPCSWGLFTLARRLLVGLPLSGVGLARLAGVSQSRASRLLSSLTGLGLVGRGPDGYRPSNWRGLLDWWLDAYPGPGGTVSYWAGADDLAAQTRRAVDALSVGRVAVSGDVAADLLAPWRQPGVTVVYAKHGLPLGGHGFVPVGSLEEATLVLRCPADPGVWLPSDWVVGGVPLADPVQIVFDVAAGPEPDRAEAAGRLADTLTSRHARAWQAAVRKERP